MVPPSGPNLPIQFGAPASVGRWRETRRFAMSMHCREECSMRGTLKKTGVSNVTFLRHFGDNAGQVDAPALRGVSRS